MFHTFEFQDDLFVDKNIDAISTVSAEAFVFDREGMLQQERNALKSQFVGEALFISRFQQAGTECAVNLNRAADHLVR